MVRMDDGRLVKREMSEASVRRPNEGGLEADVREDRQHCGGSERAPYRWRE